MNSELHYCLGPSKSIKWLTLCGFFSSPFINLLFSFWDMVINSYSKRILPPFSDIFPCTGIHSLTSINLVPFLRVSYYSRLFWQTTLIQLLQVKSRFTNMFPSLLHPCRHSKWTVNQTVHHKSTNGVGVARTDCLLGQNTPGGSAICAFWYSYAFQKLGSHWIHWLANKITTVTYTLLYYPWLAQTLQWNRQRTYKNVTGPDYPSFESISSKFTKCFRER